MSDAIETIKKIELYKEIRDTFFDGTICEYEGTIEENYQDEIEELETIKEERDEYKKILDILKSCMEEAFKVKEDGNYATFDFCLCWKEEDKTKFESYNIIKEWLENEQNK